MRTVPNIQDHPAEWVRAVLTNAKWDAGHFEEVMKKLREQPVNGITLWRASREQFNERLAHLQNKGVLDFLYGRLVRCRKGTDFPQCLFALIHSLGSRLG